MRAKSLCDEGVVKQDKTALIEEKLVFQLRICGMQLRNSTEGKTSRRRILYLIQEKQGITQKELADELMIKSGSMSEILCKMESEGHILRYKSTDDKRNICLSLTDKGIEHLKELNVLYENDIKNMFLVLNAEERILLSSLLDRMIQSWETEKQKNKVDKRPIGRPKKKEEGKSNTAYINVRLKEGLHMRPAKELIKAVERFQADIVIRRVDTPNTEYVNLKSIFKLLLLQITNNTKIEVRTEGLDSEEAMEAVKGFFDDYWDE